MMSKYSEQVRTDAAKAALYIREHGWAQGVSMTGGGQSCALGAMDQATIDGANIYERWIGLKEAAYKEIPDGFSISRWNDTPGRTKEEVLAVFDRIANPS